MDRQDWLDFADEYGPAYAVALVVAFMAWVRTLGADRVFRNGDVYFTSGNDPWYHARIVHLIVEHFPATQRFDAYSYFPYGTGRHSGFGGLFDQLIALVAMVVGLGSPSEQLVDTVIALAPVAFGALTAVPAYFFGKWVTDRWGGVLTAALLALFGGQFLSRTVIGVADHQSSEAFFGTIAFAGFLYAVRTGYAEKPTIADFQDRNWVVLRRPVFAATIGGIAIGSYLMTWGPGVAFVFTIGVFVLVQQVRDYRHNRPTEYIAIVTVIAMGVAGILTLAYAKEYELAATAFSLLQPLVVFGIGAGSIVLYGIATYVDKESYDGPSYPIVVGSVIVGIAIVSFLVFPRTLNLFESLFTRMYSFGYATSATAGTVAEITPATLGDARSAFGFVFFLALFGLIVLLVRVIQRNRPAELLLFLWSISSISAYFTMIRFGYYLAVNVALLSAFAIWWAATGPLEIDELDALSDVETYQILGVILLLILVVPGNVVAHDNARPNWETAEFYSSSDNAWQNELSWMQENTPEEPIDFTERIDPPADGDYDYPDGAYGVMSWWDYGHWITQTAHRIPNANPFQQGPQAASSYLLAQNEERANLILEALPSLQNRGGEIDDMSNDELRSVIANQSEQEAGEDTRYVVIDDQMAAFRGPTRQSSGKFGAIATWTGPEPRAYRSSANRSLSRINGESVGNAVLPGVDQQYRNTMLSRLYFQDAGGLDHYRLVHETNASRTFLGLAQQTQDGYRSLGYNAMLTERIFRALQTQPNLAMYNVRQAVSRVKTYERVEGATLRGTVSAENASTVLVQVPLQTNRNRNVTYSQVAQVNDDGEFNVTVPYSTNDVVGPEEGGTDSGVVATGNYTVTASQTVFTNRGQLIPFRVAERGTTEVPEQAIYDGRNLTVDLEPNEQNESSDENASSREPAVDGIDQTQPELGSPPQAIDRSVVVP